MALVAVFFIIKSNEKVEKRFDFFGVDSVELKGIEIYSDSDTIKLKKEADNWMITYPIYYKPQDRKIKNIYDKVITVETSTNPVAETEESQETYNVKDSLGYRIKLKGKNNKTLKEAYIGKSKVNYSYSYGRYKGDNKIYQLKENLYYSLNPKLSSWRNRKVLEIKESQIDKIHVAYSKNSFTLTATDSLWLYSDSNNEFAIKRDNKTLNKIKTGLRNLSTSKFIDNKYEEYSKLFKDPILEIMVTTIDGNKQHIAVVKKDENFILKKNDNKENLFKITSSWVNRFSKSPGHFENEENTD